MSNEILYGGHSGLVLTEVLGALQLTIGERQSFRNLPLLVNCTRMLTPGSLTVKVPIANLGRQTMAAPGENTAASNTNLTSTSATITAARQTLLHDKSLESAVARGAIPGMSLLTLNTLSAYENRFIDLIAALFGSVSASVGSTGVNMSFTDLFDGLATLELARATGGGAASVLHPQQWVDLRNSIRSEGGVLQNSIELQNALGFRPMDGTGYVGTVLNVPFFTTEQVDAANAGADRAGCLFGAGAFGYVEPTVPAEELAGLPGAQAMGNMAIMRTVNAAAAMQQLAVHAMLGVGILQTAGAVKIVTDA